MHLVHVATIVSVLLLVGVELSVSAFVNPSAWRLEPEPQAHMLSHFAAVLGRVMPVWYPVELILLGLETWLHRGIPGFAPLLAATILWLLTSLASILFLVPLNNRVVNREAGWQQAHRIWDKRHRVRIAALALAAILLAEVLVR